MKILIIGDSFATDWSIKNKNSFGWPNLLAKQFNVVNLAQAGVSEYKIYKQLCSVTVSEFDLVIVAHTSPYRVHTRQHPIHHNNPLHKHADLIYGDIEYHQQRLLRSFNKALRAAYNFFIYHFDEEFQETIYMLLRDRISTIINNTPCLMISTPLEPKSVSQATNLISIQEFEISANMPNHLSEQKNYEVYNKIQSFINEINKPVCDSRRR